MSIPFKGINNQQVVWLRAAPLWPFSCTSWMFYCTELCLCFYLAACKPQNHKIMERNSEIVKGHIFFRNMHLKYEIVVCLNKLKHK